MATILRRRIRVTYGSEGPREDPYAYTQVCVVWNTEEEDTTRVVSLRYGGLGDRLIVDGVYTQVFPGLEAEEFYRLTGVTVAHCLKCDNRRRRNSPYESYINSWR